MIKFWDKNEPYAEFSNFANYPISLDGHVWRTVEHYYQAMKTLSESERAIIRHTNTPGEAKKLGQHVLLREDWEEVKYEVMKTAVRAKFSQHEDIQQVLFNTGFREIAEDSPNDYIWGLGKDGTGQNLLGKVLVEIREELREVCC